MTGAAWPAALVNGDVAAPVSCQREVIGPVTRTGRFGVRDWVCERERRIFAPGAWPGRDVKISQVAAR